MLVKRCNAKTEKKTLLLSVFLSMWCLLLNRHLNKFLSAFSVKREHAPCQPWPLESAATGFRPLWRMCDPLLPQMSPGNTQRGFTLQPPADITAAFLTYLFQSLPSPSPSLFLFLPQPVFSSCFQEKHLSETIRSEAQVGLLVFWTFLPPRTVMLLLSNVRPSVTVIPLCHVIVESRLCHLCHCRATC